VGVNVLTANTTGINNTAMGGEALENNTTGSNNVAVGVLALDNNSTASQNTAVGRSALGTNTTGANNVALGYYALSLNTTANNNTAIGTGSLANCTTGAGNVAIGEVSGADAVLNVITHSNRLILGHNGITNAYCKTTIAATSDQRDKTDIVNIGSDKGLSFVNQLRPVSFYYNESRDNPDVRTGTKRYGFLAQEVLALEGSDNVIIDNEQAEHLKYQGEALVPVLVKALQELSAKVAELEAKIGD
jgi:hypothetical protein